MKTENINTGSEINNMETFVNDLKKEDKRNVRMAQVFLWFMVALMFLMAYPLVTNPGEEALTKICFTTAMVFGVVYYRAGKKTFSKVDYSQPTLTMLKSAAKRHNFIQKRFLNILGMLAFFEAGFLFYKPEMLGVGDGVFPWVGFLLFQAVLLISTAVGFALEYVIWHKKQKPIRDRVVSLITEIEN